MARLNAMAWLQGAWAVGRLAYGVAQNAAREQQAAAMRAEAQARKAELLAGNTPLAGMAEAAALEAYRYTLAGFYVGAIHEDHGPRFEAGIHDDRHVFIVAGSRSGKGRSLVVQNAIRWPGPLLVVDPKGEAASITAMRRGTAAAAKGTGTQVRRFLGQKVAILDPFGETRGPARIHRTRYNPLADIDMTGPGWTRRIRAVAGAVIMPEQGENVHFSETAEIILRGIIETVKLREPAGRQTLPHCRRMMIRPYQEIVAYLKLCPPTPADFAREALGMVEEVGINEWGSFRSTLTRNLQWLAEPDMQDHLEAAPFSLWRAVQDGWSVYVVLPPDTMGDFKSWLRLVVRMALDAKTALGTGQTGPQTLFLLDEFPLLGHFQLIEESAGFMAGYGIKLAPIIQNIGQLKTHYPRNWETFMGNAGAVIAFGLNDDETERYISTRLGRVMVWENAYGVSGGVSQQDALMATGGGNTGLSESLSRRERMVRFPNEIHHEAARETMRAFVIPGSGKPFMIRRQNYDAIQQPGLFDTPQNIIEWESHFSGGKR